MTEKRWTESEQEAKEKAPTAGTVEALKLNNKREKYVTHAFALNKRKVVLLERLN